MENEVDATKLYKIATQNDHMHTHMVIFLFCCKMCTKFLQHFYCDVAKWYQKNVHILQRDDTFCNTVAKRYQNFCNQITLSVAKHAILFATASQKIRT